MISTGDKGLDKVITGLQLGDNVVWQIGSIDNYRDVVVPYVKQACKEKRRVVYVRFADHKPLIEETKCVTVYTLDASLGFESFSADINRIAQGRRRRLLRIRLPVGSAVRLVQRPDDRQLLQGHVPLSLSAQHDRLFLHPAQQPFLQDDRPHPGHDPAPHRRLSPRRRRTTCTRSRSGTATPPPCSCPTSGRRTRSCRSPAARTPHACSTTSSRKASRAPSRSWTGGTGSSWTPRTSQDRKVSRASRRSRWRISSPGSSFPATSAS